MSAVAPTPDNAENPPPESPWREFARSPLVPVAVAATLGLLADRYIGITTSAGLLTTVIAIGGWFFARRHSQHLAFGWLLISIAALAATYHHTHHFAFTTRDIANFATPQPTPVRVRGALAEEPDRFRPPRYDPLLTMQRAESSSAVLAVTAIQVNDDWEPANGRVRLAVEGRLSDLHCGDVVELSGRLSRPDTPSNPGERDVNAFLLDKRITAELRVKRGTDAVVRLEAGWRDSLFGWLAHIRGWGTRALQQTLPHDEAGLATALLLGDGTALEREEWDAYVRTGVIHVLAISGQHLVILGWFVWFVLRALGVRRRYAAWAVAGILLAYAMLTGAKPSAVRAVVMVCVVCGGIVLRRNVILANAFAFSWLIVICLNPADPFSPGCQLSFLSVFVLLWGVGRWLIPRELTPVEQLIEETRSVAYKAVRGVLRFVRDMFVVSAVLLIANAPLILAWQNVASPIGVLLGPPLVALTAIALIAGFLLLLAAPVSLWLAWPFARIVEGSLAVCEWLVHLGDRVPFGHVYSPAPPVWWLTVFYLLVAWLVLCRGKLARRALATIGVWVLFGLALSLQPRTADEARVTFLAVGHGTCIVIETPDGRVLLYDTGTTIGPDAVRKIVAPFLWHRGIHRIDEVFLSHADLDHFNGLIELMKRFPIGQVTTTPTFSEKESPGVDAVLTAMQQRGIPRRIVVAGERFAAGDVTFDVLHPPRVGPEGSENSRSLVLALRHAGHTILLTGDLEGEGQTIVTANPIAPVDVMLAPHHGAKNANSPFGTREKLEPGVVAAWARPKLVISSQRIGTATEHLRQSYGAVNATVWDTPTVGAVTVRSHSTGVTATTFRGQQVHVITRGR